MDKCWLYCGNDISNLRSTTKYCTHLCRGRYERKFKRKISMLNWKGFKEYVIERDDFTCQCCGTRAKSPYELQCHHIIPLFKGGNDTVENCESLCKDCHKKKHQITP